MCTTRPSEPSSDSRPAPHGATPSTSTRLLSGYADGHAVPYDLDEFDDEPHIVRGLE